MLKLDVDFNSREKFQLICAELNQTAWEKEKTNAYTLSYRVCTVPVLCSGGHIIVDYNDMDHEPKMI